LIVLPIFGLIAPPLVLMLFVLLALLLPLLL
jgi:hypothetical protein